MRRTSFALAQCHSAHLPGGAEPPDDLAADDGIMAEAGDFFDFLLRDFQSISLDATNQSARMLKRQENKYVVGKTQLRSFLRDLRDRFAILEIDDKRVFAYSSCYFDDKLKCYYDHLHGKRLRFKIRIRHYLDSGEMFFEVKLKDRRGATNKKRTPTDDFDTPYLNQTNSEMLHKFFQSQYKKEFIYDIQPSIIVNYKRFTLVSLAGGERMTVDFGLRFSPVIGAPIHISDDFIIIETKSSNGKGIADIVLKDHRIKKVVGCSKYCIGVILSGYTKKFNGFRRIMGVLSDKVINPARIPKDRIAWELTSDR